MGLTVLKGTAEVCEGFVCRSRSGGLVYPGIGLLFLDEERGGNGSGWVMRSICRLMLSVYVDCFADGCCQFR